MLKYQHNISQDSNSGENNNKLSLKKISCFVDEFFLWWLITSLFCKLLQMHGTCRSQVLSIWNRRLIKIINTIMCSSCKNLNHLLCICNTMVLREVRKSVTTTMCKAKIQNKLSNKMECFDLLRRMTQRVTSSVETQHYIII